MTYGNAAHSETHIPAAPRLISVPTEPSKPAKVARKMGRHRGFSNAEVTEFFKWWVYEQVSKGEETISSIARKLGKSNPHITNIVNGKQGVGPEVETEIARLVHPSASIDGLRKMAKEYVRKNGYTDGPLDQESNRLRRRPGWRDALVEAKRLAPTVGDDVWEDIGGFSTHMLDVDPDVLVDLAALMLGVSSAVLRRAKK